MSERPAYDLGPVKELQDIAQNSQQTATELYPSFLPEAVNVTEGTESTSEECQNSPVTTVQWPESLGCSAGCQLPCLSFCIWEGRGGGGYGRVSLIWEPAV